MVGIRAVGRVAICVAALTLVVVASVPARGQVQSGAASQTVLVPRVRGRVIGEAYQRLRAVGLRVRIPRRFSFDAYAPPVVARTLPAGGRRVASDSVVTLYLSCCRPVRGAPTVRRVRRLLVPSFAGRAVSVAYQWANAHGLHFKGYLGPLKAGSEGGLLANYRVSRQHPAAGSRIVLGRQRQGARGMPDRLLGPSLTVWGTLPPPCTRRPGYNVVAASSQAVITSRQYQELEGSPQIAWYGCLRTVGEWRLLTTGGNGGYTDSLNVEQVRLAGRFVAFSFLDWLAKGTGCADSVAIFDLTTAAPGSVFGSDCRTVSGPSIIDSLLLAPNGFAAWHTTENLPPTALTGMSCPSVSFCAATDSAGNVLTTTHPTGGRQAWNITHVAGNGLGGAPSLGGISCPTQNLCVAIGTLAPVGDTVTIYTSTDPTAGASAWTATDVPATVLSAISCPSASLCVVASVDNGTESILTSTDPTGGAGAWTTSPLRPTGPIWGLDCPSTVLCVAGGDSLNNPQAQLITSTNPTGGTAAWTATASLPTAPVVAVSCPSASLCVAGTGAGELLSSSNPTGGPSTWTVARPSTGSGPLSCPSVNLCVSGTYSGSVVTSTNPTGGTRAWSVGAIPTTGWLEALSCPTTTLCIAGDNLGHSLTSTNPTGGPNAWSSTLVDSPQQCGSVPCVIEHVYAHDTTGTRVLDTSLGGTGNTITNLELSRNQISWDNNGEPHQAVLR